ncbi:MAG: polysaccharide biosynthesis tyrosine autokinase [Afipia sp.]
MNWTRIDMDAANRIAPAFRPLPNVYNAGYAQPGDEPPAPGLYLAQLLDTLRRRRKLILTIAICGTLLATVVALLIAPKYTASAQIIVDPAQNASGPPASPTSDESAVDTQVKVLTSHDHLQRIVQTLLADPEFLAIAKRSGAAAMTASTNKPSKSTATEAETSWMGELNRRLHIWVGMLFRDRHGAPLDIEDLERRLKVAQEGRSRVITVRYTSQNPEEAAIVANKTIQLYIDGQSEQQSKYTSRELAQLRERISEARSDVVQNTAAVQKAAQEQTKALQNQGGDGTREINTRLRALEREAAASALTYSKLQRREKEILDQRDGMGSAIRIVSLATPPEQPSSHNPILFILPILIILLIGGSFIAVIAEQGDRGLRSERDINDALGISCVRLVPQLPGMGDMKPHQYMLTEPFSAYTETIRSVVSELWLASPRSAPRTVLISSSVPGEGKTTAAVSIAVCAASLGRRVLLIDLDFKRPSVARELGGNAEREIFDILLRNQSPTEVIAHIPDLGIDYLAMSTSPLDALPILAGQRLPLLLRQLSENYDSVIIDGPPLLGIVESRLLAPMVDKVLFVVKWGSTRREVAQNAMSLLRSPDGLTGGVDIPIVLLTQVDLQAHANYRYGDVGEALVKYENYYSRSVRS